MWFEFCEFFRFHWQQNGPCRAVLCCELWEWTPTLSGVGGFSHWRDELRDKEAVIEAAERLIG